MRLNWRGLWRVISIDCALWQLRHSRELLAFMRAHSCSASSRRWSRNFSRVLIVPKSSPHTSFEACILRAILSVHSCGTWHRDSGRARLIDCCSARSFSAPQTRWRAFRGTRCKTSPLVSSRAVLNAPQKKYSGDEAGSTRNPELKIELGRIGMPQLVQVWGVLISTKLDLQLGISGARRLHRRNIFLGRIQYGSGNQQHGDVLHIVPRNARQRV